jgi:cyanophycin synthetase
MDIIGTKIYPGPSIYAQNPVIHFELDCPADSSLAINANVLQGLHERLPGLSDHLNSCSSLLAGEQDNDTGSYQPGHLFEHLCIELQVLAGNELSCIHAGHLRHLNDTQAAVAFEDTEVCLSAAELAIELIKALQADDAKNDLSEATDFDVRLDEFFARAQRRMLPVQDRVLVRTARSLNIPVMRMMDRIVIFGQGRYQQRLTGSMTSLTTCMGSHIASNKHYSRIILDQAGLPVPKYAKVRFRRAAVEQARKIGYPVVVKPNSGKMGLGVSVGMKNRREVRAAYMRAREYDRSVLIEEMIQGADYRMMVINGKLVAASKRVPGHIVGNGKKTVQALVDEVNSDPRRGVGPRFSWTRIEIDEQAERLLAELEYTLETVPEKGEVIYLRRNANTSDGGTSVDVTDEVHPDNVAIAERTAKAIGLDVAGVDFLTTDISRSMHETGGAICEVNSRPGLRKHIWPAEGKPRDVVTPIIDMLFPKGTPSRLQTVAITGTGDRSTAARLLAQTLADKGHHVGLATKGHVYINGVPTGGSDLSAHDATRMIFLDPDTDTAVIDVDPEDVLQNGLSFDACDICAILDAPASGGQRDTDSLDDPVRVVVRTARRVVLVSEGDDSRYDLAIDSSSAHVLGVGVTEAELMDDSDELPAADQADSPEGLVTINETSNLLAKIPLSALTINLPDSDPEQIVRCISFVCASAHSLDMQDEDVQFSLCNFNSSELAAQ